MKSCSVESIESNSSFQLGDYFAEKILMVHDPVFRVGYEGDIGVTLLPLLGTHSLTCLLAYLLSYLLICSLRRIFRHLLCVVLLSSSSLYLLL